MASSSINWKSIDDNFFTCTICLNELKEPKLLPCLHRFCRQCIEPLTQAPCKDNTFKCPVCNAICHLPRDKMDGLKSDILMEGFLQFIHLQKSFENQELKECYGCSENIKVRAYCFKCDGFLCLQCYQFHLTNKMIRDHVKHCLALDNIEKDALTLGSLSYLKEVPRCGAHPEYIAQLCCCTCGNLPVCVTCTYDDHKGHDLRDVRKVAKEEREGLAEMLQTIERNQSKVTALMDKLNNRNEKLLSNVLACNTKLTKQYDSETRKLKCKKDDVENEMKTFQRQLQEKTQTEINVLNDEMEDKIKGIKAEYERLIVKKTKESTEMENAKRQNIYQEIAKIDQALKTLSTLKDERSKSIEEQKQHKHNEIQNISNECKQWLEKFDNIFTTSLSVLSASNDWEDAQCVPDIRAAGEVLREGVGSGFKESLSDVAVNCLPGLSNGTIVRISNTAEYVVEIDDFNNNGWEINGIADTGTVNLVVAGSASNNQSHITVLNRNGTRIRHSKMITLRNRNTYPVRYCTQLSGNHVVCVGESNQIGIYDIRKDSYNEKDVYLLDDTSGVSGCPTRKYMSCVTFHTKHRYIVVGTSRSTVLIFDEELNFIRAIKLPEGIKWSRDMMHHQGNLWVCDGGSGFVCVVTMDASRIEFSYRLPRPENDSCEWYPKSICTDTSGFVYVLWSSDEDSSKEGCVVTQYSEDGKQLLTTTPIDGCVRCITTVSTENGEEKLIAITQKTGKMIVYNLVSIGY